LVVFWGGSSPCTESQKKGEDRYVGKRAHEHSLAKMKGERRKPRRQVAGGDLSCQPPPDVKR